jgi:hypothetical protein
VKLTVNGKTLTQPIVVKMDPRVTSTSATILQQFSLAKRVYDAIADVHAKLALRPETAAAERLTRVYEGLQSVYGLTQQGGGPIPTQNLKAINEALERYRAIAEAAAGR